MLIQTSKRKGFVAVVVAVAVAVAVVVVVVVVAGCYVRYQLH